MRIRYAPTFFRIYKKIDPELKEEVKEKIERFRDKANHKSLHVHKLKGNLGIYSLRVNYKVRIVFEYEDKDTVNFLYLGSHDDVY